MLLERCGLGLSRFASIGNQADVRLPELVEHLAGHEPTRAIAIYAEERPRTGGRSSRRREPRRASKPVILLNSGRSAAGARGAASHTGALVTSDAVIGCSLPRGRHRARRLAGRARRRLSGVRALAARTRPAGRRDRRRRRARLGRGGSRLGERARRARVLRRPRGAHRAPAGSARAASATPSTSSTAPTAWPRSRASRAPAWSRVRSTRC